MTPRAIFYQLWDGFSEDLRVLEDDGKVLVKKRGRYSITSAIRPTESREGRAWTQTISMKLKVLVSYKKREREVTYTETYPVQELRWKMIHSAQALQSLQSDEIYSRKDIRACKDLKRKGLKTSVFS